MELQLDLFEDNSEIGILRQEVAELRKESAAVRRGIFARQGALLREMVKMQNQIDALRSSKTIIYNKDGNAEMFAFMSA